MPTKPDKRPAMVTLGVPVADLTAHPRNVREGDVGAIVTSLLTFGQYRPIVVQGSTPDGEDRNVILAGTHTWLAHQAILEDPEVEDKDRFYKIDAVMLTVDDETATRIMLADNRTHDLGRDRQDDLATLLTDLGLEGLAGTGFDGEDLDTILRDLGRYDPGAGILAGIEGSGNAESDRQNLTKGRDSDGNEYFALHVSLTAVQREEVLAAFKRAKERGYATQPEALAEMARSFMQEG